jgi:hypothetical protein
VRVIRHPARLHVRVTPRALNRALHIHLPSKQLTQRVRITFREGDSQLPRRHYAPAQRLLTGVGVEKVTVMSGGMEAEA